MYDYIEAFQNRLLSLTSIILGQDVEILEVQNPIVRTYLPYVPLNEIPDTAVDQTGTLAQHGISLHFLDDVWFVNVDLCTVVHGTVITDGTSCYCLPETTSTIPFHTMLQLHTPYKVTMCTGQSDHTYQVQLQNQSVHVSNVHFTGPAVLKAIVTVRDEGRIWLAGTRLHICNPRSFPYLRTGSWWELYPEYDTAHTNVNIHSPLRTWYLDHERYNLSTVPQHHVRLTEMIDELTLCNHYFTHVAPTLMREQMPPHSLPALQRLAEFVDFCLNQQQVCRRLTLWDGMSRLHRVRLLDHTRWVLAVQYAYDNTYYILSEEYASGQLWVSRLGLSPLRSQTEWKVSPGFTHRTTMCLTSGSVLICDGEREYEHVDTLVQPPLQTRSTMVVLPSWIPPLLTVASVPGAQVQCSPEWFWVPLQNQQVLLAKNTTTYFYLDHNPQFIRFESPICTFCIPGGSMYHLNTSIRTKSTVYDTVSLSHTPDWHLSEWCRITNPNMSHRGYSSPPSRSHQEDYRLITTALLVLIFLLGAAVVGRLMYIKVQRSLRSTGTRLMDSSQ